MVALQNGALFAVVEICRQSHLPVQVMSGALRGAYHHGVPQGTDLPQAGDTLRGLLPLFNSFPEVTFSLSVLSDSQAHELASYGWIVQNVVVSGHWWYDNMPAYIERDLAARIQSVPKTKLIGYYSDMYKLEFGLPKFNMYRRVLARVLARDFVEGGRGTEDEALCVARLLLRDNARRIFNV
jgi:glucuronate isomerase